MALDTRRLLTVLGISYFSLYHSSLTPWYVKNDTEERNERARKAYSALLIVTARTPNNEEYKNFSIDVSILSTCYT